MKTVITYDVIDNTKGPLGGMRKNINIVNQALYALQANIRRVNTVAETLNKSLDNLGTSVLDLNVGVDNMASSMTTLSDNTYVAINNFRDLYKEIENVLTVQKELDKNIGNQPKAKTSGKTENEEAPKGGLEDGLDSILSLIEVHKKAKGVIQESTTKYQEWKKTLKKLPNMSLPTGLKGLSGISNDIGSLAKKSSSVIKELAAQSPVGSEQLSKLADMLDKVGEKANSVGSILEKMSTIIDVLPGFDLDDMKGKSKKSGSKKSKKKKKSTTKNNSGQTKGTKTKKGKKTKKGASKIGKAATKNAKVLKSKTGGGKAIKSVMQFGKSSKPKAMNVGKLKNLTSSIGRLGVVSKLSAAGSFLQATAVNALKFATGTAIPFLLGLITQTWAWTAALLANPVTWIVVGILALVAAIVACWNQFAEFRAVVLTIWDVIVGLGGAILDYLLAPFRAVQEVIGGLMEGLSIIFSGGGFMEGIKAMGDGLKKGLTAGADSLKSAATKAGDTVSGIGGNYDTHLIQEKDKQAEKEAKKKEKANITGFEGSETPDIAAVTRNDTTMPVQDRGANSAPSGSTQITYAPQITISSELTEKSKADLMTMLQENAAYIANLVKEQNRKEGRLSYGVS